MTKFQRYNRSKKGRRRTKVYEATRARIVYKRLWMRAWRAQKKIASALDKVVR